MKAEGPHLEALMRRLAECPAEFLEPPRLGGSGVIDVVAVVSDLLVDLGGEPLGAGDLAHVSREELGVVLVAARLLDDPWFRSGFAGQARTFLTSGLATLASVVPAAKFVTDPERREELARLCLMALGLRPAGETETQAQDRLTTVDSVETRGVVAKARKAQERTRQLREAMKRKAAEEAAARVTGE